MSSITQNTVSQYKINHEVHNHNIKAKIKEYQETANKIKTSPAIKDLLLELNKVNGSRIFRVRIDRLFTGQQFQANSVDPELFHSMVKAYTEITAKVDAIGAKITALHNQPRVEAFELETPAPAKGENNQKNCLLM